MRIDQLLSSYVAGDAISAHAARLCLYLRDRGIDSDVYAADLGQVPVASPSGKPADRLDARADAVIYHLSVGSDLYDRFAAHSGRHLLDYHNITPGRYFEGWDPPMVEVMRKGRRELWRAARITDMAYADSDFNRAELVRAGYTRTAVLPILAAPHAIASSDAGMDAELAARRRAGRIWLFVGRFVPNKCQADVVRAFAAYRRAVDPEATLLLIGSPFTRTYMDAVEELATRLDVRRGVIMRGPVTDEELESCYCHADVLVCLSEHEGYCVPVIEAMQHGVPVVAYEAGAVPETAGDAAILLDDKDPVLVAAIVAEILSDSSLREDLILRGAQRAREMSVTGQADTLDALVKEAGR